MPTPQRDDPELQRKRESGWPGGGAGRRDEVGRSGVYPMSGPHPPGDAPLVEQACWGQGERGAAGYEDAGESELMIENVTPEKCRDLMTKDPVCCLDSDSVRKAAQLMLQYDVGMMAVVGDPVRKRLIGVVTDRDLALRVVSEERDPASTKVGEVMSKPVISCSPDDHYQVALDVMERQQIRRVPVLDDSGRIVGIISQSDVALRLRDGKKTGELVKRVSSARTVAPAWTPVGSP